VSDANTVLIHALAGKFEPGLHALSGKVITSKDETRALLAEHFFALRILRTDQPIYPEITRFRLCCGWRSFGLLKRQERIGDTVDRRRHARRN